MTKDPNDKKKKVVNYMKYAGLGTQMAAILAIGIWGGQKLDAYFGNESPAITMLLVLFLFTGIMYKLFKELS